ncbi:hybrid sensor histidine kinase/response regulator [Pseudoxanthomonas kalamensis DSM 18571]|uniref:PAS domain-containing hybrid sensor histidine kinase/response regulator n=1 Tax=Pseudoxanthomonas kalamensis TaxID=289483 RepID=UPI001391D4C5|nr:PAS-domain containing protein [Pseudoxanthomonas kalamensis]KAF1710605.1 hybrid sensor histidine kinase/response regulator [Pseudoxanthomonas kalamensis DSM 18571]
MLSLGVVVIAALLWLALLFGTALYAERHAGAFARQWRHVYALSLAVHCTSWTFYGTVTQAVRYGWPLPPTFVGAILFYLLAVFFMIRLVRLARESNATSLADLIATRLGKDAWLAATVTLIAALGLIPYIALQLRAVTQSFATLTAGLSAGDYGMPPLWRDGSLYLALAMALFAMLFGTRRASAIEHNRGLVLAIAFESVFKLVAMLVLGAFVWFGLTELREVSLPAPVQAQPVGGFVPLVLLGALGMFIMPHQFHVGVVECRDDRDIRTARWQFPLYLLLIAIPGLPLARAGASMLGDRVSSDMYALAVPMAQGYDGVALLVFLGGLSAATGMVIVSTLTLSLMIGNHWFAPGLLRSTWSRGRSDDHRGGLLMLRRACIVAIMLLGWSYNRLLGGNEALADVGAVSFSALATLTPALAFAVWRPQTPARAATAGVLAGFLVWAWVMLVPMLVASSGAAGEWLREGPWGLAWLAPDSMFGLTGWSRLARAVGTSLCVGTAVTLLLASRRSAPHRSEARGSDLQTLRNAGRRFLPSQRVDELLRGAPASGPVPAAIEAGLERELAAVLGSASARLLLDAARREAGPDLDTVAAIVGEASQDLRFNQRLLQAALENMSQGISVVDRELKLVAWNRRYAQLFGYPKELLRIGVPVADLVHYNLRRLGASEQRTAHDVGKRLQHMHAGTPYVAERRFPDGTVVEIRGNPMPSGGFVATFTDVTAFRDTEAELKRSNETLEQRVQERTASLDQARREAERANDAKSRFLAAVGHDLLQPLHAAQLFTDSLSQQLSGPQRTSLAQVRGALDSTSDLLTGLFDMSRLEAGGLVPEARDFPLAEVLEPLASEFRALSADRGLRLRYLPSAGWVHGDPQLLRRVLQNFLANAVRYTAQGSVLLGVRREGGRWRIEVHDTGPGIAEAQQELIFEEFRRGDGVAGQGLGLGLAIADRIARLMRAPLRMRSRLGRGTVFSLSLPMATAAAGQEPVVVRVGLDGIHVLLVDNDPAALAALRQLLQGWGCTVDAVANGVAAERVLQTHQPALWLFDYHLDDGDTGVALYLRLAERHGERPTLILSADDGGEVRRAVLDTGLSMLQKPVRPLALKSVLDRMLARRMQA